MHERAVLSDLVRQLERVAAAEGGRIAAVRVRLGALSHFTPGHFLEHFRLATAGTAAEGAAVEAIEDGDTAAPFAQTVLLESVEIGERS